MVLHQTFKWGNTNPSVPKQQLVWNSKVRNIKKNENRLASFLRERKKESFLTSFFLRLCLSVSVFLCLSPAVIDLTQLQLKQKKN